MSSYFLRQANTFRISSTEAMHIEATLPVGNYVVKQDMTGQFFLEMADDFLPAKRLYGRTTKHAERILNTFLTREPSTGVLLNGEKGSGKTLLARTLAMDAAKQGIPTLLVNQAYSGDTFNKFLQDIEQPCMLLFDEFEKVYGEGDQESILTLFDGVFPSKKLFVLTCNNKWRINEHMRNRPGRILYMLDFSGLEVEFIEEYCNDNLDNKAHIPSVCRLSTLFEQFNFDMLKALVEEMNRYGETPQEALALLNIKPEDSSRHEYEFVAMVDSDAGEVTQQELYRDAWHFNPLTENVEVEFTRPDPAPKEEGDEIEFRAKFSPKDIVSMDAKTGLFDYKNSDGDTLRIRRVKVNAFDHYKMI
jgi:hypothetical protein